MKTLISMRYLQYLPLYVAIYNSPQHVMFALRRN